MAKSKMVKPKSVTKVTSSDEAVEAAKGATGNSSKGSESGQLAKAQATVNKNTQLSGIPELVAGDKVKYVKHEWAGARQAFPAHKSQWYVDLFFPYAQGGPLFIDQIKNETHKKTLVDKLKTMKKLGHRYLQLTSDMDVTAALEQLA